MAIENEVALLTVAVNGVTAAVEADTTTRQHSRDEAVAAAAQVAAILDLLTPPSGDFSRPAMAGSPLLLFVLGA